jgi:RNA polymerase sigma factor (sigma-70 family)
MPHFSLSSDIIYEISLHIYEEGCMQQLNAGEAHNSVDGTLYDRFASTILTYLCQQVSNVQDAEDLLLEVFLAALNSDKLSSLPAEQQLDWLRRVARNKVIDRYRHTALFTMLPLEHAFQIEDDELTPEQHTEQQENYERLYQALEQLPPLQQELIQLRYGNGLSHAEIAGLLEKPQGTVRKLLTRTLRQLRTIYDQIERGNKHETNR